jgi:hypothetical protein
VELEPVEVPSRQLVTVLHRRWIRYKALMGPPGSAMATLLAAQPLGRWAG